MQVSPFAVPGPARATMLFGLVAATVPFGLALGGCESMEFSSLEPRLDSCGDDVCSLGEGCSSCSADCGSCPATDGGDGLDRDGAVIVGPASDGSVRPTDAGGRPDRDGAATIPSPDGGATARTDAGAVGTPPARDSTGLWLSRAEIARLPTSGRAYDRLVSEASGSYDAPGLSPRNLHNTQTLAAGLLAARLDDDGYRARVRDELDAVMRVGPGSDTLAACRRLGTYVIAADLAGLGTYDPAFEATFRAWVHDTVRRDIGGDSIIDIHERRPNNWGTHAAASRIAAAIYTGDRADLDRAATVFHGYVGDRSAYAGFSFGELDWQANPSAPVAINPVGARIEIGGAMRNVDGVLPDDQRRDVLRWPPPHENYVWEGLQGVLVAAELLARQGYPAWEWEDRAILRAVRWLYDESGFAAEGDDSWQPWLVNYAYGTAFPAPEARSGKNMGFTDWTHAR